MSTTTYRVDGMTCDHCMRAVIQEVGALPGVRDVTVDLPSGQVTVRAERDLTEQELSAAVDEAGYQLVS